MKSSRGMRPSLFLSILRKRSVRRDFLWFMNLRNCGGTNSVIVGTTDKDPTSHVDAINDEIGHFCNYIRIMEFNLFSCHGQ